MLTRLSLYTTQSVEFITAPRSHVRFVKQIFYLNQIQILHISLCFMNTITYTSQKLNITIFKRAEHSKKKKKTIIFYILQRLVVT